MHRCVGHRSWFGSTGAVLAASMLVGCGGGEPATQDTMAAPPPAATPTAAAGPATPQMIAMGDSIFKGQAAGGICYTCHGPDAKGTQLGPNLTDQQWLNTDGTMEGIVQVVTNGVPTPKQYPGPMPAFGQMLTPDQVRAVSAYVYSLTHPSG